MDYVVQSYTILTLMWVAVFIFAVVYEVVRLTYILVQRLSDTGWRKYYLDEIRFKYLK